MLSECEWCVELTNSDGDVVDSDFFTKYSDAVKAAAKLVDEGLEHVVCLVHDFGDHRSWAYFVNNKLPEYFKDGFGNDCDVVPKKYKNEVDSYNKQA